MAVGDVFKIPQILGEITLQKINTQIRLIWQQLNYLAGRNAEPEVRDSLTVRGTLTSSAVSTGSLTIGSSTVTPLNPTLSPSTESALMGVAQVSTTPLGVGMDLLEESSPFTMGVKDDFLGNGSASDTIGELGWEAFATTVGPVVVAEVGHPGVCGLSTSVGPDVAYLRLNSLDNRDLRYLAAVVKTGPDITNANIAFGYTTNNPLAGVETARGAYISYVAGSSANWRAHTRNASGSATTTTSIPVVTSSWFLLEIVFNVSSSSQTADFYVNRQRAARHTTFIDAGGTSARPVLILQATAASAKEASIDQFILTGAIPLATKRWS